MNEFPRILRKLRESKGLKQRTLSELCGLHPAAISRYEKGMKPDLDSLVAIADHFHCSLDALIGRNNF